MTKSALFRVLSVLLTVLVTLGLGLTLAFGVPGVERAPRTEGIAGSDGNELAAYSILDLSACSALTYANYTPGEFLIPNSEISGAPVELGKHRAEATRGTYVFVVLNLDPDSPTFTQDAASLQNFLYGDRSWHFTLHLPAVWSACNVYVDNVLTARVGEISGYDFSQYGDVSGKTESHDPGTQSLFLDLSFYSGRTAISAYPDRLGAAQVITIHYETESAFAGMDRTPVIGTDSAIRRIVSLDSSLLAAFGAIAAVSVCLCIFFCLIKHTAEFIPEAFVSLGIFGIMIFNFAISGQAFLPSICRGLSYAAFSFVTVAALLPLNFRVKKFPVSAPFILLGLLGCVTGLITPFLPVELAAALNILRYTAVAIDAAAVLVLVFLCAASPEWRLRKLLTPTVAAVTALCGMFIPNPVLVVQAAVFWLLAGVLLTDLFVNLGTFIEIERRNEYLTHNLEAEATRQTEDMRAVIDERDTILRFISHDLKKPVLSMQRFLSTLREREQDGEQVKAIDIVRRKNDDLKLTLDQLSKYARNNYVAERSMVFDVRNAISSVYENLSPDCEANGIRLIRTDEFPVHVFAKRACLINVLNNLVMNAIEHAECSEIVLSAVRKKGRCLLTVEDNGKGIRADDDPFAAYVTEGADGENLGLGLYICRSLIHSMSGTLDYDYREGRLVFTISLPIS